jgi:cell wall-associated NlpC family hydrolase
MKGFNQIKLILVLGLMLSFLFACDEKRKKSNIIAAKQTISDTSINEFIETDTVEKPNPEEKETLIDTASINDLKNIAIPKLEAEAIVDFAKTLVKTPYVYGGKDPKTGFDNLGFINYVFNHFKINLPPNNINYTTIGKEIPIKEASKGDFILFSNSDSHKNKVSYIGIITSEKGMPIEFIYATSGKAKSVTISTLNSYYQKRLIAIRSLFK